METATPLMLPGLSWTEDSHLVSPKSGRRLERWGSALDACKILRNCDLKTLYILIESRQVRAYKLNPQLRNSPYRVDLLSAWQHRERQM